MAPGSGPKGIRARVRLGLVSYLNSRPIGYGLLHGRQKGRFEIVQEVPSGLADSLQAGSLDLALIPSVEYARARNAGTDTAIVPGIAIGSAGPAESVLFFSRVPLLRIGSIALDTSSRTSVALLRVLLRRRLRPGLPDPDFHPSAPELPAMLDRCEAALMIGDRALFAAQELAARGSNLAIVDLGAEWTAMTGRPFVFAFWAGPPREDSPEIVSALQDSLQEGIGRIAEIAREEAGGDPAREALVRDYLTHAIRYGLGREEIQGLTAFFRMLAEEGLLGSAPELVFHRTAACTREPR